jgi:hypothetical protein
MRGALGFVSLRVPSHIRTSTRESSLLNLPVPGSDFSVPGSGACAWAR